MPLEPPGFDYNPDGRRDPFVSLVRRGVDAQRAPAGSRPAGLSGFTRQGDSASPFAHLPCTQGHTGLLQGAV